MRPIGALRRDALEKKIEKNVDRELPVG